MTNYAYLPLSANILTFQTTDLPCISAEMDYNYDSFIVWNNCPLIAALQPRATVKWFP